LRPGWLDARRAITLAQLPAMGPSNENNALCSFRSRCRMRIDGQCNLTPPPLKKLPSGAEILCHHSAAELSRMQATGTVAA
jgi:peptide/nickel transport system ATP-binding protein